MNRLFKILSATLLTLTTASVLADKPITYIFTDNRTDLESNAFIEGMPSLHPTPANKTSKVGWSEVSMACHFHAPQDICTATIKMGTNNRATEVVIGTASINMKTGEITYDDSCDKSLGKYTLKSIGLGKTLITQHP